MLGGKDMHHTQSVCLFQIEHPQQFTCLAVGMAIHELQPFKSMIKVMF